MIGMGNQMSLAPQGGNIYNPVTLHNYSQIDMSRGISPGVAVPEIITLDLARK